MTQFSTRHTGRRSALLRSSVLAGASLAALLAAPSFAQEGDGEDAQPASDTIVITGSRIASDSTLSAPSRSFQSGRTM